MNKTAILSNVIISVILNLLFGAALIGAGVLVLIYPQIISVVLNAAFVLIGLIMMLSSIPGLISGIASIKQKKGVFDLIFSLVTMVLGGCLAFYGVCMIIIASVILSLPGELVGTVLTIGSILRWVLGGLIALYLIILPIVRVIVAKQKFLQIKAELAKLILGVLLLVLLFCGLLFQWLNNFVGIVLIVLGVLTVLFAILHLIIGLIGLGKKGEQEITYVAVDTDGDGQVDAVAIDVDGDGKIDAVAVDVDGDGTVDAIAVATEQPAQEEKTEA